MNTVGQLINRSRAVTGARRTIMALLTLSIGFSSSFVFAQDSLEEIVVTAQRREQSLQDVPISINAFSASDIESNMFDDVTDFVTRTPNISWSSTGSRSRRELSIRGTTNFLNVNSTLRSNTFAFYEDDFSIGGSSGNPPLMDIERIEVLRGPQATYFGRNAMGGGISVTTKKPNAEKIEGSVMFDYSNFDTKDVEAVVNVPVIKDVLALRGNIKYFETDGNIKNIQPDDKGNDQKNKYARVAARWTPNEDLTVDIVASVGSEVTGMREGIASGVLSFFGERLFGNDPNNLPDADGNGFREGNPDTVGFWPNNTNRTNFGDPQEVGLNYRQIVGRIDYEWNNLLFTSITGHIDSNFFLNGDIDGISLNAFQEYRDIRRDSVSQEFRIQNTDDGRMRWSIGGIWAKDNGIIDSETFAGPDNAFGLPGGTGGEQINQGFNFPNNNEIETIESLAIFGQFDFDFTDRLTVSVGARWAEEDPTFTAISDAGVIVSDVKSKFKSFSPRFAANYAVTEDINLYGTISKGFKSGGVTGLTNETVPYDPEVVWNHEIGVKATLFESRLQLSAALFFMNWTDMQVEFLVPVLTTGGVGGNVISNAEEATSKGAELSLTALPMDNLVVNFNLGYLRAQMNKATIFIRDNQCNHVPPSQDCNQVLDGSTTPMSPKWTASADAEYTFPVMDKFEGFGRLEWTFRDTVSRTLVEGLAHRGEFPWKVPAYNFFNLRAGIRSDAWAITAYAENLFDKDFFQNAYVKAWGSGVALEPSMQSYGIRLRYNYN